MSPERWRQVEEVLQAALDRAPEDRAAFFEEACAGDESLKNEAISLVDAFDEATDFMVQPAIAQDSHVLVSDILQSNIGRDIGPYKIVERLGGGGMGDVYLARDVRLNRPVALKILPSYFASDDMRLRRFQREARAASALNHPNILTIHEVGEFEGVRFIATEYIEGKTIREVISDKDLSLAEVLEVAEQVAFALSAAHAAGIVHRDIKPENIMRRKDGIVKILDFGIAKLMEPTTEQFAAGNWTLTSSKTEVGVVIGTAAYMSPEQARGLAIDERTDIWSLGVVLYEMLSRRQPFSGSTRLDTMVSILEREPAPLCDPESNASPVLQELQRIVSKTLCKDRDERYQTATALLADLQDARHQLESEPESDALRLIPITDVRTVRVILIAALLIPAIIVGSILYNRYRLHANTSNPGSASTPTMKLYSQMSDDEQLAFLHNQEQRISAMMGERPAKLNDDAIQAIKRHVDRYVARADSQAVNHGEDALPVIYSRAAPFAPMIARAFSNRKIPIIVGIYLPMIESEYEACHESPLGANGLFQFLPQTAQSYGVERADMCNAEKMSPAAAHYIADRMAELGEDAESMTLVLLSYNTGAEAVRDALRRVRDKPKFERNFWTLLANRDKLGDVFRKESAGYVPRFFAAAIIGENPQNFGLQTPALSSLAGDSSIR